MSGLRPPARSGTLSPSLPKLNLGEKIVGLN